MEAQVQVPAALSVVYDERRGIGTHMSFTPLARAGRKYEASVSLSCLCTVGTFSRAEVVVASSAKMVMTRDGEREDEEGCCSL